MIKKREKLISFICLIAALALPRMILAANPALIKLDDVASGNKGPYMQASLTTLTEITGLIVGIFLSLIGIIFLLLMIFAGYNWMTAQGEEEKVSKAKDTIARSIIGLIIVLGSYAVWKFIFSRLF